MNRKDSFLKSNWKKYLFELLVIIAGITISFGLQNWNEQRNHQQHEIQLLKRMLQDLAVDTTSIRKEIKSSSAAIEGGQKLMDFNQLEKLGDSIGYFVSSQLMYSVFTKSDIAYQGFRQTGRGDLVSDEKLLDKIVRQYAIDYKELEEWTEIDKNFVLNQLIPYINNNFPSFQYISQEEVEKKFIPIIKEDIFQNLTFFNIGFKSQMIENYNKNLEHITDLMGEIQRELEELE